MLVVRTIPHRKVQDIVVYNGRIYEYVDKIESIDVQTEADTIEDAYLVVLFGER